MNFTEGKRVQGCCFRLDGDSWGSKPSPSCPERGQDTDTLHNKPKSRMEAAVVLLLALTVNAIHECQSNSSCSVHSCSIHNRLTPFDSSYGTVMIPPVRQHLRYTLSHHGCHTKLHITCVNASSWYLRRQFQSVGPLRVNCS